MLRKDIHFVEGYLELELELIYLSGRVKAFRPFLPLNQSDTCTNNNKIS